MREQILGEMDRGASENGRVKVLYVAGWGRSGSTILGSILGQVESFFLVGELRYIWDRGMIENRLCSCGAPFDKCPVWGEIISVVLEDASLDAERLCELRERGLRTRHLLFSPSRERLRRRVDRMGEYPQALESVYRAVQSVSGSRVIVDTSKFPSYGYVLQNIPGIDLYVLHLTRDPRAVAYSWGARRKLKLDREGDSESLMTPHGLLESSLVWSEWNFVARNTWRQSSGRYMPLRYEDFVADPRGCVRSILRFVGENEAESPFVGEREVSMGVSHTFSGNPDRFRGGTMKVRSDEIWKREMSVARQMLVTALTWPGLIRHHYPLSPQRAGSRSHG